MSRDSDLRPQGHLSARLRRIVNSDLGLSLILCLMVALISWAAVTMLSSPLRAAEAPSTPARHTEAVVVLAGAPERWTYAAALLEQGYTSRLLSTLHIPECLRNGRPIDTCATGVRNTVDEAIAMRRVLMQERIRRTTIVTSDYHALRTGAIFAVVFAGSGIEFNVLGAPSPKPFRAQLFFRELVSLTPSIVGALIARVSPAWYESLLSLRER